MNRLFYVGDTGKYGKGLFAARAIKKGETIAVLHGKIFTGTKYDPVFTETMKTWIQVGAHAWLVSLVGDFINHSCNPNAGLFGRRLAALQTIRKGEHIAYDYDIRDWDEWGMPLRCRCGAKNCRKVIKRLLGNMAQA